MLAVGTVVWLASELMFFGGLFAAWFTLRSMSDDWSPAGTDLPTASAAIGTAVFALSAVTMYLAQRCEREGDRSTFVRWWVITLTLGALFLVGTARDILGLDFGVATDAFGSMFIVINALHTLHVVGGLILGVVVLSVTASPTATARHGPMVEAAGYFWYFVVITWICVFLILYVIG